MVHFGSTYTETRELTIDAINKKVAAEFPQMTVAEAFTSRIVIRKLKQQGIHKSTPREALLRLAVDGYTHVFVQSTNIIDGIEMAALREEVEYMAPFFSDIRVGHPLLYSVEDGIKVVDIMSAIYPLSKKQGYIFVGHGTHTSANAMYSQIDYMFTAAGRSDCHVMTVEGYPTFDTTLKLVKNSRITGLTLIPFMFVAGDHAHNDIAVELKGEFEKSGYHTSAILSGLGELPQIQDLFIQHIKQGLEDKPLKPSEYKRKFLAQ